MLCPLHTQATVLAVGQGTARALRRHGIASRWPRRGRTARGCSGMPGLQDLRGRQVALIGAAGGRGLLREHLPRAVRSLREVHVYRRVPPRLDRRHITALPSCRTRRACCCPAPRPCRTCCRLLPSAAWSRLYAATAWSAASAWRRPRARRASPYRAGFVGAAGRPARRRAERRLRPSRGRATNAGVWAASMRA